MEDHGTGLKTMSSDIALNCLMILQISNWCQILMFYRSILAHKLFLNAFKEKQ